MPAAVPVKISGEVKDFHVNVKRVGVVKVEMEAATAMNIQASGPGAPAEWTSYVSSTYADSDIFATPDDVQRVLNRAANISAEEAVRRLLESGVVSASK
jgi:hypothetical protein